MYVLITRMRENGVARDWKAIRQTVGIRGEINIRPHIRAQLNRSSDIAEIRPEDMPFDAVPLSPLLDARLTGMPANAFTLSDLEEIEGVLYEQSWWCREDRMCSFYRTPGWGMQIRHGVKVARWDQLWDQRMHFRDLPVITHADSAQ